jgi:hypothetical protein
MYMSLLDRLKNKPDLRENTAACIAAIDDINNADARRVKVEGQDLAFETYHAVHVTNALLTLDGGASDALLIAGRASHIARWETPRVDYPQGLKGYFQWKEALKEIHGQRAAGIMAEHGFSEAAMSRVKAIIMRIDLPEDAEAAALEDALCLTFLETQLEDFMAKHAREKVIDILQKTWAKMTEQGRARALKLTLSDAALAVVKDALR